MPQRYTAKEERVCWKCDTKITIGSPISWTRSGEHRGVWHHIDCGNSSGSDMIPAPEPAIEHFPKPEVRTFHKKASAPDGFHPTIDHWEVDADGNVKWVNNHGGNSGPSGYGSVEAMLETGKIEETTGQGAGQAPDSVPESRPVPTDSGVGVEQTPAETATDQQTQQAQQVHQQEALDNQAKIDKLEADNKKQDDEIAKQKDKLERLEAQLDKIAGPKPVQNGEHTEHFLFDKLVARVEAGLKVYPYGLPGCGKSHAAFDVSKKLNLEFGTVSLSLQSPAWLLMGFVDAHSQYVTTPFRKWYEFGGLFVFEEVDNSSGNLLASLNSAAENKMCAFPDGVVDMHESCRMIVTGNTNGQGGDERFPDRQALDGAFLNRFAFMEWVLDPDLEKMIAMKLDSGLGLHWLEWIRSVREFCQDAYQRVIVSPRSTYMGIRLLHVESDLADIADAVLWHGLDKDTVEAIMASCPYPKPLSDAFSGGVK